MHLVAREVEEYSRGGGHIDDKVLMVLKVLEEVDPVRAPSLN